MSGKSGVKTVCLAVDNVESPQSPPAEQFHQLLTSLRHTAPRLIQSPPTQPRRASVALIIRMKPAPGLVFANHIPDGYSGDIIQEDDYGLGYSIDDFFRLPWVNHPLTVPELLFIRRSGHTASGGKRWSSHVAFPGGRHEATDESALYTALRETWEEIGVDLAEREYVQVGRLDEREITTSLGKRLLMILSPFVFLQTSPFSPEPELQAAEVSSVHWIPLPALTPPYPPTQWSHIEIDISTRLSPRNQLVRWALRGLVGKMEFGCVLLPDEPEHVAEGFDPDSKYEEPPEGGSGSWFDAKQKKRMLRLWGLSLGMTLDLLAHYPSASPTPIMVDTSASARASPERGAAGPKTPVTVTSSFDEQWEMAKKALDAKNGVHGNGAQAGPSGTASDSSVVVRKSSRGQEEVPGASGAGLDRRGSLGRKVDIKGMKGRRRRGVGPGVTAVFPRFSYPDVNFWIWVFGRRYRKVVKGWENSVRGPDRAADRRTNWSGAALSTFYSAVRQALVVAIIIRAIATGIGIGGMIWWFTKRFGTGGSLGEL